MTDLGFGFVDRRSVLIVLFTLGLSNVVLGNPLPIDASNVLSVFLGLLILTGFIYVARSVLRLAITLSYAILRFPFDVRAIYQEFEVTRHGLRGIFILIWGSLKKSYYQGFFIPAFVHRDWPWLFQRVTIHTWEHTAEEHTQVITDLRILGIIDRMLLVGLAFISSLPLFHNIVEFTGFVGIGLLILLYVITGRFTLILEDAIYKADQENVSRHIQQLIAAQNPRMDFPPVMETKPYVRGPD